MTGLCLTDRRLRARRVDLRELHTVGGQSVGRATPSDGVPRGDRGRRLELADGTDAGAVVEAVPPCGGRVRDRRGGQQVRLRRGCGSMVRGGRRTTGSSPHCPSSATTAIGVNVEAVVLMGAAPVLFLAFVARRRASMPASVRATSRPAFAAALVLGLVRALDLCVDDGGCASQWVHWTIHDDRDRRRVGRARALWRHRTAPRLVGVDEAAEQEGLGCIERGCRSSSEPPRPPRRVRGGGEDPR